MPTAPAAVRTLLLRAGIHSFSHPLPCLPQQAPIALAAPASAPETFLVDEAQLVRSAVEVVSARYVRVQLQPPVLAAVLTLPLPGAPPSDVAGASACKTTQAMACTCSR